MNSRDKLSDYNLTREEKQLLLDEIKYFFSEERNEEIGIIASEKVLDFFLDSMGKHIYNKALDDAKFWFGKQMENLESDFYTHYKT